MGQIIKLKLKVNLEELLERYRATLSLVYRGVRAGGDAQIEAIDWHSESDNTFFRHSIFDKLRAGARKLRAGEEDLALGEPVSCLTLHTCARARGMADGFASALAEHALLLTLADKLSFHDVEAADVLRPLIEDYRSRGQAALDSLVQTLLMLDQI